MDVDLLNKERRKRSLDKLLYNADEEADASAAAAATTAASEDGTAEQPAKKMATETTPPGDIAPALEDPTTEHQPNAATPSGATPQQTVATPQKTPQKTVPTTNGQPGSQKKQSPKMTEAKMMITNIVKDKMAAMQASMLTKELFQKNLSRKFLELEKDNEKLLRKAIGLEDKVRELERSPHKGSDKHMEMNNNGKMDDKSSVASPGSTIVHGTAGRRTNHEKTQEHLTKLDTQLRAKNDIIKTQAEEIIRQRAEMKRLEDLLVIKTRMQNQSPTPHTKQQQGRKQKPMPLKLQQQQGAQQLQQLQQQQQQPQSVQQSAMQQTGMQQQPQQLISPQPQFQRMQPLQTTPSPQPTSQQQGQQQPIQQGQSPGALSQAQQGQPPPGQPIQGQPPPGQQQQIGFNGQIPVHQMNPANINQVHIAQPINGADGGPPGGPRHAYPMHVNASIAHHPDPNFVYYAPHPRFTHVRGPLQHQQMMQPIPHHMIRQQMQPQQMQPQMMQNGGYIMQANMGPPPPQGGPVRNAIPSPNQMQQQQQNNGTPVSSQQQQTQQQQQPQQQQQQQPQQPPQQRQTTPQGQQQLQQPQQPQPPMDGRMSKYTDITNAQRQQPNPSKENGVTNNVPGVQPKMTTDAIVQQKKQLLTQSKIVNPTSRLPRLFCGIQQAPGGNIILSWDLADGEDSKLCENVESYHLFAHQAPKEGNPNSKPPTDLTKWRKIGVVNALPLPMACSMTQFASGNTYNFAALAVDKQGNKGTLSNFATIRPAEEQKSDSQPIVL